MKKKININQLKVQSFITNTSMDKDDTFKAKGGVDNMSKFTNCITYEPICSDIWSPCYLC